MSLLKEYKREVARYIDRETDSIPPLPEHYLDRFEAAILREYQFRIESARANDEAMPTFPEVLILANIDNTWHDSACSVVGNWMGLIYQITHKDRRIPFMPGVDENNPLKL